MSQRTRNPNNVQSTRDASEDSWTDALLLGDEGYGITPCLKRERLIIERCFGQLKKRFPILQGRVTVHLNIVPSVIVACCIMHNVAQDPDDFPYYVDLSGNIGNPDVDDVRIRQRSQERRHQLSAIIHGNDN